MLKIAILGANGMLGTYVNLYLRDKYTVTTFTRKDFDLENINNYDDLYNKLYNYDIIINCAGVIKPRIEEVGINSSIKINSIIPVLLSSMSRNNVFKVIHITTDCVYSGNIEYPNTMDENTIKDAKDLYGISKSLGESENNCTIIRTSIIGEEAKNSRSLLEWAKSNKNNNVNGFTNHWWNGVTCLELAKRIEIIINKELFNLGIIHTHSDSFSKDKLLSLISEVYDLNLNINLIEAPNGQCNRLLSSIHKNSNIFNDRPLLKEQLIEMKNFKIMN